MKIYKIVRKIPGSPKFSSLIITQGVFRTEYEIDKVTYPPPIAQACGYGLLAFTRKREAQLFNKTCSVNESVIFEASAPRKAKMELKPICSIEQIMMGDSLKIDTHSQWPFSTIMLSEITLIRPLEEECST